MLRVGDEAPEFRTHDAQGREVSLESLAAAGPVVLYFYPKDFTRVCTAQACFFRDSYDELKGFGAEVVGVSLDADESHRSFAEKHALPFALVSDTNRTIARAYGVLRPIGPARRVTYVIGRDKRIRGVFHHELSAQKHIDDVRALLKTL